MAEIVNASFWTKAKNLLNVFEFKNKGIFWVTKHESENKVFKVQNCGLKIVKAK